VIFFANFHFCCEKLYFGLDFYNYFIKQKKLPYYEKNKDQDKNILYARVKKLKLNLYKKNFSGGHDKN
tara:strand:- start:26 stop:229 length:204 start_codon:yes stop_codon:yes gene_type:complete